MSDRLKAIIQQVLLSDSFCNNLQSAIQHVSGTADPSSSSTTTTTTRSAPLHAQNENVAAELRKLFPSINSNERSTTNKNRISKKRQKNSTQTFKRTVFLLKSPTCERTLTGIRKRDAFKEGYALVAVNFAKSWAYEDIEAHLREIFCSKLPEYVGFEILMPVSGYLVKPNMSENASLDGENLSMISNQKPIYIRPTVELTTSEDEKMVYSDPVSSASDRDYLCENNVEDLTPESGALYDEHYEYNPYEVEMYSSKDEDYRDTDIETAIKNSLMTIEDILKELCNKIDREHTTIINVCREDVYNCFIRALKRKNFCPFRKLSVSFTDINSKSEGAFDAGGPTRELFSLLVQHLHYRSRVFEGPDGSKNLSFCADALDMNEYYYAGLIMAMSVIHGGPSPAFLSPVLYAFLTDGDAKPSLMDIGDEEIRNELIKISNCTTITELKIIVEQSTYLPLIGCTYVKDLDSKNKIVESAIKFYVFYRAQAAIEQFIKGLEMVGMYSKIKENPGEFKNIMCKNQTKLTSEKMKAMFFANLNPSGSNKRQIENRVLAYWWDYLIECEEEDNEVTLSDILKFVSGVPEIPPLGFADTPQLKFLHEDESVFPKSNTCAIELHLPIKNSLYNDFKQNMNYGILNGMVFGFA